MFKLLFYCLFFLPLFGEEALHSNYYINSSVVKLSDITHRKKDNQILFTITRGHTIKRIKTKTLLTLLKKYNINNYSSRHPYIQFEKKSPISTTKITEFVKKFYKDTYKNIKISQITIHPKTYTTKLPNSYTIHMPYRSYLHKSGTLSIKTDRKRQIFFDYVIKATLHVFVATKNIKRNVELSSLNTRKKSIILENFRALPLHEIQKEKLESKIPIPQGKILTQRDVETLHLIRRGDIVNVLLQNGAISISFSAKAIKSGKLGDTITIEKNDGKRMKVQVTGKKRVRVL